MKINLRQEIAMWVFGLLWAGIALRSLMDSHEIGNVAQAAVLSLVLLVPIFLIIFSLRDRKKAN